MNISHLIYEPVLEVQQIEATSAPRVELGRLADAIDLLGRRAGKIDRRQGFR